VTLPTGLQSLTFPSTVQKDLEGASLPNSLQSLVLQGVHFGWLTATDPSKILKVAEKFEAKSISS
jgi:hypothetical protein